MARAVRAGRFGGRLFSLGVVVATPGAQDLMISGAIDARSLVRRHARGDWGDLEDFDRRQNDEAVESGARIFSAYETAEGRVWIITDATDDEGVRESTCMLLPHEY